MAILPLTRPALRSMPVRRRRRAEPHLLGLISDILDLSRLERGVVEFDLRAVNLRADRQKLVQVILNLAGNAIRSTRAGGGAVSVEVEEDAAWASTVRLRVADTGIGIPADQLEAIFQPFVQVQRGYTRDVDGAGLGLAISRDLARAMRATSPSKAGRARGAASRWCCRAPNALPVGP